MLVGCDLCQDISDNRLLGKSSMVYDHSVHVLDQTSVFV